MILLIHIRCRDTLISTLIYKRVPFAYDFTQHSTIIDFSIRTSTDNHRVSKIAIPHLRSILKSPVCQKHEILLEFSKHKLKYDGDSHHAFYQNFRPIYLGLDELHYDCIRLKRRHLQLPRMRQYNTIVAWRWRRRTRELGCLASSRWRFFYLQQ